MQNWSNQMENSCWLYISYWYSQCNSAIFLYNETSRGVKQSNHHHHDGREWKRTGLKPLPNRFIQKLSLMVPVLFYTFFFNWFARFFQVQTQGKWSKVTGNVKVSAFLFSFCSVVAVRLVRSHWWLRVSCKKRYFEEVRGCTIFFILPNLPRDYCVSTIV